MMHDIQKYTEVYTRRNWGMLPPISLQLGHTMQSPQGAQVCQFTRGAITIVTLSDPRRWG